MKQHFMGGSVTRTLGSGALGETERLSEAPDLDTCFCASCIPVSSKQSVPCSLAPGTGFDGEWCSQGSLGGKAAGAKRTPEKRSQDTE